MSLRHIMSTVSQSELTKVTEDSIQPNAVDIRLDRVWRMDGEFLINEDQKLHREKIEVLPDTNTNDFYLPVGSYEITFHGIVKIGANEAGVVITRSTLNRNGVFITSGLYDSGYEGSMAACLHVNGGPAIIRRDTRIAQFLLFDAEALKSYDGDYGLGKTMDAYLRKGA